MKTDNDFDPVIAEGFARTATPTTSEEEFKKACHPLVTDRCPSIPTLEKIARGGGSLKQWVHKNTCAYCQKSVTMFMEMLDIKPWWVELRDVAQQAIDALTRYKFVRAGTPGERSVKAEVLLADLTFKPVAVNLMQCRFTGNGHLWMLMQLEQQIEEVGSDPLELTVVADDDRQMFGPYLLPDLNAGQEEELLVLLPPALQEDWQKMGIEAAKTLPFQFILRPRAVSETDGKAQRVNPPSLCAGCGCRAALANRPAPPQPGGKQNYVTRLFPVCGGVDRGEWKLVVLFWQALGCMVERECQRRAKARNSRLR